MTPDEHRNEDIPAIQASLRRKLIPEASARIVSEEIQGWLERGHSREELANIIAQRICATWTLVPRGAFSQLKRLIANRPMELCDLLERDFWEALMRPSKTTASRHRRKQVRAKPKTTEERISRLRSAKDLYERRRRRARIMGIGRIESESLEQPDPRDTAGRSLSELLFGNDVKGRRPEGPCLDAIMKGGEVQMSRGIDCLEELFGRSRKLLPKGLPGRRDGRELFYGFPAVLQCMDVLLRECDRRRPWLVDRDRRRLVLSGILRRAKKVAPRSTFSELAAVLNQHLG